MRAPNPQAESGTTSTPQERHVSTADVRPSDTTTATTADDQPLDLEALEAFAGHLLGLMTGAVVSLGVWLGDELGLYRALAGNGPTTVGQLAEATGCHPQLVREWLDGQTAAGLVVRQPDTDTYALPAVHAAVLADDESPAFMARGMNSVGAMFIGFPSIVQAFLGDGGVPWGDHDHHLFTGTEWFFRPGYRAFLTTEWLPALEGVVDTLASGGRVADVGCGHGASVVAMAEAFPEAVVTGIDPHAESVEVARHRIREAGVEDRVDLRVATATDYGGTHDLICFFDSLHDMGDPVAALRHARDHLAEEGAVMLVEPMALDDRDENIAENPLAAMFYHASAVLCVPNSLSQDVGVGLGTQAGEARLREVLTEAGFRYVRRAAETPTNIILEARP